MKKIIHLLFLILILSSCKKSTNSFNISPGNTNNQVNAMIAVKGSSFSNFSAIGNSTVYSRWTDPNGDAVITVLGGGIQGKIKMVLVNINVAGTYTIGGGGPAGSQYIIGSFEIGNALTGPYELFLTPPPPPPLGSIIIDELTSTSIRGSFSMNCIGSTGTIQIINATFKGIF